MALALALALAGAGCGGGAPVRPVEPTTPAPSATSATSAASPSATTSAVPTAAATPRRTTAPPRPTATVPVTVRYRVEVRTRGAATRGFPQVVERTLLDPRGWQRAGFRLVRDPRAAYLVVIAEGDEVDRLCRPYDTYGKYSCQNGPVVAINADRWRHATPEWTGDLETYRQMLVNHEVGHLLGQHHPTAPQCPRPGRPARVMSQQSTELNGCLPNPWPLPEEIALAARHDEPLAPPYSG